MKALTEMILTQEDAAEKFAALGSEHRLAVLQALVSAGPAGLSAAALTKRTGIAGSRLTHHLRFLTHSGLVTQERQGRQIISRAAFDALSALSDYILLNCCADAGEDAHKEHQA